MKLSITQIACALDLPEGKIERWIRQGRIPLVRREDVCVFDRPILERWAAENNLVFEPEGRRQQACGLPSDARLSSALKRGGVYYDIEGRCVVDVLTSAVNRLAGIAETEKRLLVEKLVERESLASTGIGQGIAIPHPREPESLDLHTPAVSACFLATPIDFKALDGQPVSIMFLLLSPDVRTHLQILSKLSFCLRNADFIAFLRQAPAPESLMARLDRMESPDSDGQ